ncbi:uncharacterized protein LOC142532292 [Primulina tabacum]|uniref:uncharacterized protein LOC142532292 n=1 Tax=Primulina tabacum TaxID=48773 RepID=UPI003F598357
MEDLREARVKQKKLHEDVRRFAAYHLDSERQHEITKQELKKAQDRIFKLKIRGNSLLKTQRRLEERIGEQEIDEKDMAGRPPRNNHNPRGTNQNKNPPQSPRVNLSQEDMMAIATIVAATLQGMRKWWETVSPSLDEVEEITWQNFKREFLKQYYPAEFRLQKLSKFENFKQTPDMTVMEYTSRLNDLGTYVPTIMSDETLKMHHFKRGLNSRIQSALAVFQPNSFADLMGAAMSAETDIKRREEENKNKRPMVNQPTQNGPKFKKPNYSGACFKCGQVGHRIKECLENKEKRAGPKKQNENKTNARVYAITQEEADNTNEVVAGTILLNDIPAYTLFDCGATHSFMSRRFAKKLKLEHNILSKPLRVATPASKIIETHKVHRNSKNHAIVDCQRKNIRLQTPTKEEIIYYGKSKGRKSLLSASQAWKAIKGREEIYLAMINEVKREEIPKMEDIPIVQEFPDVFPEELPGEILDREEEFEINLVPGTAPISKAPY